MTRTAFSTWRLATADLDGFPGLFLADALRLRRVLDRALGGAVEWSHHEFSPVGVSMTGTADTMRIVVHTWPESGASTIDVWCACADPAVVAQTAANQLRREARRCSGSPDASNDDAG